MPSTLEKNLCKKFPTSTIIALEENSTVDSFGFSLIRNGQRIRVLNGCDGEYYFNYGEPIDEEISCYEQVIKELSEEEKLEIIENEGKEGLENHLLFEAKWRVPFELFKSVYGKPIEQVYDENKSFRYFPARQRIKRHITKVLLQAGLDVETIGCGSLSAAVPADGILLGF